MSSAPRSGITLKPRRPVLPLLRRERESLAIGHGDLRQTLGVHDIVLLNHAVLEEEERGQRVDLIGLERALFPERHAAVDVVPHHRRERRVKRHDVVVVHARRETRHRALGRAVAFDQRRRLGS